MGKGRDKRKRHQEKLQRHVEQDTVKFKSNGALTNNTKSKVLKIMSDTKTIRKNLDNVLPLGEHPLDRIILAQLRKASGVN